MFYYNIDNPFHAIPTSLQNKPPLTLELSKLTVAYIGLPAEQRELDALCRETIL